MEILFGSKAKARLLRFFLLNSDQEYSIDELSKKTMLKVSQAKKELNALKKIKFVIEKKKKGGKYYAFDPDFPFYAELKNLVVKSSIYPKCGSLKKIKSIGDVKLSLVSGMFLNYPKNKVDMILVAENVSRPKLNNLVHNLEAELGKEITYVLMNSEEFKYRLNMLDRFLLDFLEGPHDEIVNKIPKLKNFIARLKNK